MSREIYISKREAELLVEGLRAVTQYYTPESDTYREAWSLVRSLNAGFSSIRVVSSGIKVSA